jgi:hypothetical protein
LFLHPGPQILHGKLHGGDGCQLLGGHPPFDLLEHSIRLGIALQRTSLNCLPQRQQGLGLVRRDGIARPFQLKGAQDELAAHRQSAFVRSIECLAGVARVIYTALKVLG